MKSADASSLSQRRFRFWGRPNEPIDYLAVGVDLPAAARRPRAEKADQALQHPTEGSVGPLQRNGHFRLDSSKQRAGAMDRQGRLHGGKTAFRVNHDQTGVRGLPAPPRV